MNVRWDAVVERPKPDSGAPLPTALTAALKPAERRSVSVQLFGALAIFNEEKAITLEIDSRATVVELLETLCARLGEEFRLRAFDDAGAMNRCCRLFVDGVQVENTDATLCTHSLPSQIEIILLTAAEGG